jgi:competence protein ComFC
MHKIINIVGSWVIGLFFPESASEQRAEEVVASIAKIRCDDGDRLTKYPCPAYSFFVYRNSAVRTMIWRLKYRGNKTTAELFAKRMYDQLCEELAELAQWSNFRDPVLVAIPVSKKKLRLRGFNQSEAVCKALATIDEDKFFKHIPNVLYKIKDTKSQARVKDKKSRLENPKDSFAIKDKTLIEEKNIILLDDVLTTGSTLTEATHILKTAGAKNIIWVVVAH